MDKHTHAHTHTHALMHACTHTHTHAHVHHALYSLISVNTSTRGTIKQMIAGSTNVAHHLSAVHIVATVLATTLRRYVAQQLLCLSVPLTTRRKWYCSYTVHCTHTALLSADLVSSPFLCTHPHYVIECNETESYS